ncbi:hypothetical protein IWQ60_000327 [Tieghemiomyces parasiticus]|uniref:Tyrosine specific protein phosphatases domain-containing protein n=1 Tax=Tieghemiomyces parasiticus TaxID=78921 RepID=A0A9W8ALV5_9FUNG|nr:hypothetical protein IWQ60_000327 [Tieghemiomyces parasiticus]
MEVQGHPVASLHHAFPAKSTAPLLRLRSPLLPYSRYLNFLITECPTPTHLAHYVRTLRAAGVTDVVKVCDASYDHEVLERQFIQVHTLNYPDDGGRPPTPAVVETWLNLVRRRASQAEAMGHHFPPDAPYRQTIAIHCVAGLGRAPLLVALALVDVGMTPMEAVKLVQRKRRGALYNHHVDYVVQFARQRQLELTREASCQWSKRGLHRTLLTRCRSLCRLVKTKGPQRSDPAGHPDLVTVVQSRHHYGVPGLYSHGD